MPPRVELPLIHPLDMQRALAPLRALADRPYPFLLQSAMPQGDAAGPRRSRWSFFGAEPFAIFRGGNHEEAIRSFRRFRDRAPFSDAVRGTGAPFVGGAVGYWSYDYGRRLEALPSLAYDDLRLPDFIFALYDVVGAYDHDTQQTWLFSSGLPFEGDDAVARARQRLDYFRALLERPGRTLPPLERAGMVPNVTSTFSADGYRRAVEAVQTHIRHGDIFQANLTQRWRVDTRDGLALSAVLYESMTQHTPAPYAAYLRYDDHAIMSASPERFLELRGEHIETRPIKGTRPRGATPEEDAALAAELLASAKDRAENVMIIDVLRNDLGRVCEVGSIHTPSVCELESFAQVHHLTSTVTGRLRQELDAIDLLHACFPGGSITGAPKIRAMEILDSLEPVRRHIYTGSIGWLGWDCDADWQIAIRTVLATPEGLLFHAGGGVTADSDPSAEYEESLVKAEGVRLALSAVLGELTLRDRMGSAR
ncbi:MAG: aminodeoxychorismate synthase component I [Candidatus Eisenbacteria bacterium]